MRTKKNDVVEYSVKCEVVATYIQRVGGLSIQHCSAVSLVNGVQLFSVPCKNLGLKRGDHICVSVRKWVK